MNGLNEWAQIIAKRLKSEAELVGVQARHELYEDAARETFIRVVLEPFLPGSLAIGSGRVIDAAGNSSDRLDIIIYSRDYPQLNLPGSNDVYLYESVLATIEVKSKMIRKTFIEALDSCASMAELNPVISDSARARIATKFNMTQETDNSYINTDALQAARFELEGRPPSFVYAFSGFQTSHKQLAENIDIWVEERAKQEQGFEMKHFPATIATQGCFALRNAAPFSIKSKYAMGVGTDSAPIRLIVLQLMLALNRRLRLVADTSGIRRSLDPYLKQLQLPKIASGVVKVGELKVKPADAKPPIVDEPVKKVVKPAAQIGATLAAAAEAIAEPRAAEVPAQAAPIEEPEIEPEVIDITDVAPPREKDSDPFANFMREALPSTAAQPVAEPLPKLDLEPEPAPEPELAPEPEPVPEPEPEHFVSSSPITSTLDDADADPFPEPEFFDELLRDDPPKADPVPDNTQTRAEQAELDAAFMRDAVADLDSFIETMKMPDVDISTASQEDDPKAASEDADAEPFSQTMRVPVDEPGNLNGSSDHQQLDEDEGEGDYEKTMTVSVPDIGEMERKLRVAQEENPETDPFLHTIPQ